MIIQRYYKQYALAIIMYHSQKIAWLMGIICLLLSCSTTLILMHRYRQDSHHIIKPCHEGRLIHQTINRWYSKNATYQNMIHYMQQLQAQPYMTIIQFNLTPTFKSTLNLHAYIQYKIKC